MQAEEPRQGSRFPIWRGAILFTPVAIIMGLLVAYLIYDRVRGGESGIVFIVMMGVFFLLFAWQATQSVLDLWAAPVTTTGIIRRKWSRPVLLIFGRSYYIHVERCVFSIDHLQWSGLELGDVVSVRHYPHTWTVIDIERVENETRPA
jgi:hypothetical protein